PLFCNQCGGRIADGSVFCNLCGAKQGVVAPAQVAPGVPPAPGYPRQAPGVPGGTPMGQPYNPNAPVQQARPPPLPQLRQCSPGMMMHGDTGAKKAAGAALFALTMAAAAAGSQNRNQPVNTQQVVRVRDRIQMQYNIPIVAVRGYTKYQPDDGFQFQLQSKMNFDKRQTGGVDVQSGDVTEAEAKSQAAALSHKFAEKQAKTRVDNLESIQVYPTTYDGDLIHAPVWFMEYAHKGKALFI